MSSPGIDCIIPAAGRSSRMGEWKPALPFGTSTIVETVVAAALGACGRAIVVAGYRGDELAAIFRGSPRVLVIENPGWESGMFSSLRCAAARVESERFFITPADMPWIVSAVYTGLMSVPATDVVFPVFGGRRGHPVLLSRAVAREMLNTDPTTGIMRAIISGFASTEMAWTDDSVLRDLDTPQEYSSNRT